MNDSIRLIVASFATIFLFFAIQVGALALATPFADAGLQAVDDPTNPRFSIFFFGVILVATGCLLVAFKWDLQWMVRGMIILVSGMIAWFVFAVIVPPIVTMWDVNLFAVIGASTLAFVLYVYPEWYVIDVAGIIMGAGAAGLFGISFGVLPVLILLTILAIYDAISVYGTKHMLSLAEGAMDIKVPVMLVIPVTLSYSYLADHGSHHDHDHTNATATEPTGDPDLSAGSGAPPNDVTTREGLGGERDALFIGLGDAIIPTILVVSAAVFAPVQPFNVQGIIVNLPAVSAMIGIAIGLVVLLWLVLKGRPHAGLPLLNGGAILGYLLGALYSGLSLVEALGIVPFV